MTTTNEKFIQTYEKLVEVMRWRAGIKGIKPSPFAVVLANAAALDHVVKKYVNLLRYIGDVRNTLQHPQQDSLKPAVVVSNTFLKEAQDLLKYLRNPTTARSVGVPRRRIRTARLNDRLGALADEMKRRGFNHLPILGKRDAVIGVFNEASVFNYLWADNERIIGRNMLISDILPHCRLNAGQTETFQFVSPDTSLDELTEVFLAFGSLTRVGAVFVTNSGKKKEPLRRLITAWDVLATSNKK